MEFQVIAKREELLPYMRKLTESKITAVDTETTGLNPHYAKLRLIQIAASGMPVMLVDCFSFLPEGADLLELFFSSRGVKIFHNAKFDLQFLMANNLYPSRVFDTMLAARLLRSSGAPESASLKSLVSHYLNEKIDKEEQKSDWSKELNVRQLHYAALDAEVLLRLREKMVEQIYAHSLEKVAEIEFHCVKAIAHMEYRGIYLDVEMWSRLTEEKEAERSAALERLYKFSGQPAVQQTLWGDGEVIGCNFDNNSFVVELLAKNEINVAGTSRQELLPYMEHPLVKALLAYRKAAKALSSFLYPFPEMINRKTGRLHPSYGQINAWSGRMNCSNPNIQQIPREEPFRSCFRAPAGKKLLLADYSQIELRVAADISGDRRMITAYENGEDLHMLTASLICGKKMADVTKKERQAAKAVNFGLIFGMGAGGLQQYARLSYGVTMSYDEAVTFRDRFFKAYPGIESWHNSIKNSPAAEGRTLAGRKFIYAENSSLSAYYNTPVQGTAADIAKKALGILIGKIKSSTSIVAVIHDEILLECPENETEHTALLLKESMEKAGSSLLEKIPCEAVVQVSESWAEK